jgi:chromosome partitioning protein
MRARIIGVSFHKGGSGKTTTAVNLAAAIAARGIPTLLVDADPQGAVIAGLGGDPEALHVTLLDALVAAEAGEPLPDGLVLHPDIPSLDIIPSDIRLARLEQMGHGAELLLGRVIDTLRRMGRWQAVVIDSPPTLGVTALSVLLAASELVIPVQTHYLSVLQVRQFMQALGAVGRRYQRSWNPIVIVPTMVERGTRQAEQSLAYLAREFGPFLSSAHIPKGIAVANAQSAGLPVCRHAPSSPVARAYDDLAEQILSRVTEEGAHEPAAVP